MKPALGPRFEQALIYAARLHARQTRKGKATPYIAHLMGVAAIVLDHGGTEDHAIAGLLHDAVEDQGGRPRLRDLRRRFGPRVARMVEGCTDAYTIPKPPWRERKEAYLKHLRTASRDTVLVSAADKLHNAREILADLREGGAEVWDRFQGKREGTLWYYRALVRAFRARGAPGPLVGELARIVRELTRLA